MGAVAHLGLSWNGLHGSNYAARNRTRNLREIDSPFSLQLGDLVYKAKKPGDSGYDLPERYRSGQDLKDYYHVGVVTCTAPLEITHCTSVPGGIQTDIKIGNWAYHGACSLIEKEEGGHAYMETAVVVAENGYPVKLRKKASTSSDYIDKVPVGTVVELLEWDDEWSLIRYNGREGYMMSKFLQSDEVDGVDIPGGAASDEITITLDRKTAMKIYDLLGAAMGFGVG